jgi:transcriptional regulator with XRE-family HTH domain
MTDFKAIRTELGFTQKELGELLGIDPTQISKAENGHDVPAMYEYALKGLQAELDGRTATSGEDTEPLKARIAELEAQLVETNAKLIDANNQIIGLNEQALTAAKRATTTEQPKRRGLGRPKGAQVHGME